VKPARSCIILRALCPRLPISVFLRLRSSNSRQLRKDLPHRADKILHMTDRLIHQLLLIAVELDLNNLLHAA